MTKPGLSQLKVYVPGSIFSKQKVLLFMARFRTLSVAVPFSFTVQLPRLLPESGLTLPFIQKQERVPIKSQSSTEQSKYS